MAKYNYLFYTEGRNCFVGDFITGLSEKEQGKVKYYFDLLEDRGPLLREPYAKKIDDRIYELRPGFGNTEMRLFYFWDGNTAWFVHGIVKKTQKTPLSALAVSEKRMKSYFNAKQNSKNKGGK